MPHPAQQARFLAFQFNDAASNMAIDEAILEAHSRGIVPTTLRLYGFSPPAVSIGYGQKLSRDAENRIKEAGLGLVRRPTGGRAVLHLNDLTYSFVGSIDRQNNDDFRIDGSIIGAYKQICQGLVKAMALLGIEVEMGQSQSNYRDTNDCFAATTAADLHYRGTKLIGSAQLRRGRFLLQHGSLIPLEQPIRLEKLISNPSLHVDQLRLNADNLIPPSYIWQGKEFTIDDLQSTFRQGFEQALNLDLKLSELTSFEDELTKSLASNYRPKCA